MSTRDRQLARLTKTRDDAPQNLEVSVSLAATDLTAVYQRWVQLAEDDDAGCLKSAGSLLAALGLSTDSDAESKTFLAAAYAKIENVVGTFAKNLPAKDETGRAKLKNLCLVVLQQAKMEVRLSAEAGRLSPEPAAATGALGGMVSPTESGGVVHMKTKKDQEDDSLAKMAAFEQMHRPRAQQWPATMNPARSMYLLFDKFTVATCAPNLPQFAKLTKEGRAQTVPSGRSSTVLDLVSVMLAMRRFYSAPMPEGFKIDARYDLTMLEWKEPDPADRTKLVTLTRPAQLSGQIVDNAIVHIITALEPLSENQRIDHGDRMWNQLMTEMSLLQGYSLSRAVARVFCPESNSYLEACREVRGGQLPPRVEKRPVVKTLREGERAPESPDKRRKLSKDDRRARPSCSDWEKDGRCSAFSAGNCKGKQHPGPWANIGRREAEKRRSEE